MDKFWEGVLIPLIVFGMLGGVLYGIIRLGELMEKLPMIPEVLDK